MYDYKHFTARFDRTPRVKRPMVSEVYFAWCYQAKPVAGFIHKDGWQEGECFIHPDSPAISIEDLEEDRASKFELDYEKDYYKDHYAMLVVKYRKGDKEYTLFLTPEHAHGSIEHGINCDDYGVMIQPEYSWEELNFEAKEEENDD